MTSLSPVERVSVAKAWLTGLNEGAIEAPWEIDVNTPYSDDLVGIFQPEGRVYPVLFDSDDQPRPDDALLIVTARNVLVPAAIALLEEAMNTYPDPRWNTSQKIWRWEQAHVLAIRLADGLLTQKENGK